MRADAPGAPTRDTLTEALEAVFESRPLCRSGGRCAAVALVVGEDHGTLGFLLTKRGPRLTAHGGQYALPGGRVDPQESIVETALRELHEELDLRLMEENVVGRLPDYRTASGFRIAPVVAWAGALEEVKPNPGEVAEALHVPLAALLGPAVPTLVRCADSVRPIIQLPLGGERVIHAPTGAILYQFAEAAFHRRYVDAEAFEEPAWARC